jgi:transcriptional regulator with XRE-family HTH domain
MNITEKIKEIRKAKKLSQQELADKMNMHRVQYTRIETGKTEPTISTLEKIAIALEVDIINFFKKDNSYDLTSKDKTLIEKVRLLEELDEKNRNSIFTIIDTAINSKRLRDSLSSALNIAS